MVRFGNCLAGAEGEVNSMCSGEMRRYMGTGGKRLLVC